MSAETVKDAGGQSGRNPGSLLDLHQAHRIGFQAGRPEKNLRGFDKQDFPLSAGLAILGLARRFPTDSCRVRRMHLLGDS